MKKLLFSVVLALPLVASAQNLLGNGSFETGPLGTVIPSWTPFQVVPNVFPPSVVPSTGAPIAPFGTVVSPNTQTGIGASPDAVGTKALYFVDDDFPATVFQTLPFVAAGTYLVGFDYFIPTNGLVNPANANLSVCFGPCFSNITVNNSSTGGVWRTVATTVTIGAGATTFSFAYQPDGVAGSVFAKDIVVDRAYVVAVPEPESYMLFAAGLMAMGAFARRRNKSI